jgi:16S rRNA (uracil1498-N3)-methyltransferase
MTMRLHVGTPPRAGEELSLPAAAARHAQVRRVQPGDPLVLFDGSGSEWRAQVLTVGRSEVRVRVGEPALVCRELPWPLTMALAMPANERMDLLVEKATELGVGRIQPLMSERSVLRLAAERAERKREHWQAIAVAASEQCGRTRVPTVAPVQALASWLDEPRPGIGLLLSLQHTARPLHELALEGVPELTTLSGPEGGLTPAEEAAACARGFLPAALGPRVLRADTAPLAVLAWLGLKGSPASPG